MSRSFIRIAVIGIFCSGPAAFALGEYEAEINCLHALNTMNLSNVGAGFTGIKKTKNGVAQYVSRKLSETEHKYKVIWRHSKENPGLWVYTKDKSYFVSMPEKALLTGTDVVDAGWSKKDGVTVKLISKAYVDDTYEKMNFDGENDIYIYSTTTEKVRSAREKYLASRGWKPGPKQDEFEKSFAAKEAMDEDSRTEFQDALAKTLEQSTPAIVDRLTGNYASLFTEHAIGAENRSYFIHSIQEAAVACMKVQSNRMHADSTVLMAFANRLTGEKSASRNTSNAVQPAK